MRDENPWQEYLFPHDPSGEVTKPPGRAVGIGVALVEVEGDGCATSHFSGVE